MTSSSLHWACIQLFSYTRFYMNSPTLVADKDFVYRVLQILASLPNCTEYLKSTIFSFINFLQYSTIHSQGLLMYSYISDLLFQGFLLSKWISFDNHSYMVMQLPYCSNCELHNYHRWTEGYSECFRCEAVFLGRFCGSGGYTWVHFPSGFFYNIYSI